MANFPSVTAAGAFESTAVQNAIKALAEQAVADRLAVLEYDSDWRDVTADLANGWTGELHIRRIGMTAWFRVRALDGANASQNAFYYPTNGFSGSGAASEVPSGLTEYEFRLTSGGVLQRFTGASATTSNRWVVGSYPIVPGRAPDTPPPGNPV